VNHSGLELLLKEYGASSMEDLVGKVFKDASASVVHGSRSHLDDTILCTAMYAVGKSCYRVTTAKPEDVAKLINGELALVADMHWRSPVGKFVVEVGGRRVAFIEIDHHDAPMYQNVKIPTAAEMALPAASSFRDRNFMKDYFTAVALHDRGLNFLLDNEKRIMVGQFVTRPLFFSDEPVAEGKTEKAIAHAFSKLTLAEFQKLAKPTAGAATRGVVQALSGLRLHEHELVKLAEASLTDNDALAYALMSAEGYKLPPKNWRVRSPQASVLDVAVYGTDRRLVEKAGHLLVEQGRLTLKTLMQAKLARVAIVNGDGIWVEKHAVVSESRFHLPDVAERALYLVAESIGLRSGKETEMLRPKLIITPSRDGGALIVKTPIDIAPDVKIARIGEDVFIVRPDAVRVVNVVGKVSEVIERALNTPHRLRL